MESHYKTLITKSENKGSDEIKMYQVEMKKIQSKITELYSNSKSEYAKLVLSKQKQRHYFDIELKKLFSTNAELEVQLANYKLQVEGFKQE